MVKAAKSAAYADTEAGKTGSQADELSAGFRERLALAVAGHSQAELARKAGLRPQMIGDYIAGRRTPGAANLFAVADALDVDPRWLISGAGEMRALPIELSEAELVYLPRYDLFAFGEGERPSSVDTVPLQREWLIRAARTATDVWLAEMPSDAMPDVAREGETILCRFAEPPLQDRRVYVLLLDGRPIVRRVQLRPGGLLLTAGDPSIEPLELLGEDVERVTPVARVLASISLQPA